MIAEVFLSNCGIAITYNKSSCVFPNLVFILIQCSTLLESIKKYVGDVFTNYHFPFRDFFMWS